MNRPYIICHILSALDSKITGKFMGVESARSVSGEYARIRAEYQADAWLYGTATTKEFTGWRKPELDFGAEVPDGDFVAEAQATLYYVSVDTQGEIGWESGTFLQQGAVDELSLLLAPAADGNPDSVTVFEKSPLLSPGSPATFRLKNIERLKDDGVRLVYTVISKEKEHSYVQKST